MDITVRSGRVEEEAADAVVVMHCEGEPRLTGGASALDARLNGRLAALLKSGEFTGTPNQVSIVHVAPGEDACRESHSRNAAGRTARSAKCIIEC